MYKMQKMAFRCVCGFKKFVVFYTSRHRTYVVLLHDTFGSSRSVSALSGSQRGMPAGAWPPREDSLQAVGRRCERLPAIRHQSEHSSRRPSGIPQPASPPNQQLAAHVTAT